MKQLICMAFDGAWVREGVFDTIEQAWERASDLGSKWYFYPFPFVLTESGKTIADSPDCMEIFNGKRFTTVLNFFNRVCKMEEAQGLGVDEFISLLYSVWVGLDK